MCHFERSDPLIILPETLLSLAILMNEGALSFPFVLFPLSNVHRSINVLANPMTLREVVNVHAFVNVSAGPSIESLSLSHAFRIVPEVLLAIRPLFHPLSMIDTALSRLCMSPHGTSPQPSSGGFQGKVVLFRAESRYLS